MIKNYCPKYTKTINTQKPKSGLKIGKRMNRHLIKEDIQMTNNHIKVSPTVYVTREKKIKTKMELLYTR